MTASSRTRTGSVHVIINMQPMKVIWLCVDMCDEYEKRELENCIFPSFTNGKITK